jgi:putative tricarboxylic transport membrane protein
MSVLNDLLQGFGTVLSPQNLLFAAIGVTLGTFVGVLPGIGPALTIGLLLPVALQMDSPTAAFIMFAGIYYGAMYGGSTTSILLNTPGESASVASAIEGHQMAKRGRGKAALATAAVGSFVAGTLSTLALTLFAVPLASLALQFQAPDYFALALLAMVTVTALVGRSLIRGMMSLALGLLIGLIGIDQILGQQRFTFGMVELMSGISVTLLIVGLFAVGETLHIAARLRHLPEHVAPLSTGQGWMTRQDWRRSWAPWLRGTAIGFPFGALPAGGAEIPTFLSYTFEKFRSKHKKQFGQGAIEGVAGPEAANNAAFSGVLVPLLTLGIPTSATAAVMLASLEMFNIQSGPQLFEQNGALVWALIASLYVGNVLLLVLNLPLIRLWVKVLQIPRPVLYASILVFAVVGVWASSNQFSLLLLAIGIGIIGFLMRMFDFPIAPVVLGAILGPMMDTQFRRTMALHNGDVTAFFERPLTITLLVLTAVALVVPYLPRFIARLRGRSAKRLAFGEDD